MRRQIVAFLLILIMLPVSGQKKWLLEDCIRYAIDNNMDVKQVSLEAEKAEQNYRQSKWNMMPFIGASSSAGYSFGKSENSATSTIVSETYFLNNYNLGASVDLFNGFSVQNQISYNKFRKHAAENLKLKAIDELAFLVMNSFYDVIYYEELLKITREQKELSQLNFKKTEVLVSTGLKATADLLEVKANLEKDELLYIQTENKLESALMELRKYMNFSPDSALPLVRNANTLIVEGSKSIDIKTLYDNYSLWSPEIKSYENYLRASRKNLGVQRAGFYPVLGMDAGYGTFFYPTANNKDFKHQFKTNQSQSIRLSLNIPIFRRNTNITNVKLAKLDFETAKTKLEQAKRDLLYDMITNYNDLKASLREFTQAGKQFEADTLAYRAAEKKYDQGMINVVDLYTAKNRMATTSGQVLRSELTVEIKKRIISFYEGDRFWEK